ncbi:hypothetical protein [Delftia acidovorans]|uniref:hypothetical protein n=1 Tax=Delftia acidovorans TaxID=80866 RepID=UPI001EE095D3|nr:hypothetical protein [Delftia acidovorans]MCG3782783.1 hypothetical protein [Delftia acidovorans]
MQKADLHKARDLAAGLLLLATLLGSGAGLGYWLGTENMRTLLVEARQAHVDEIGRLQEAHRTALQAVSGTLQRAAADTAQAADTAAAAAETAQGAAAIAGKAAKAAGLPAAAIERDRKAINSTIQRANERIGEVQR